MNEETLPPATEQDPLVQNETPTVGTDRPLGEPTNLCDPQPTPATPPRRRLIDHIVNPANDRLVVEVMDETAPDGANHCYRISGYADWNNPSYVEDDVNDHTTLLFQRGSIAEVGVNGITHEALLAILCDRLAMYQAGKFACHENALALDCLRRAQLCLQQRTKARMARGVEGTHEK